MQQNDEHRADAERAQQAIASLSPCCSQTDDGERQHG
jgi:hypothetical protein